MKNRISPNFQKAGRIQNVPRLEIFSPYLRLLFFGRIPVVFHLYE